MFSPTSSCPNTSDMPCMTLWFYCLTIYAYLQITCQTLCKYLSMYPCLAQIVAHVICLSSLDNFTKGINTDLQKVQKISLATVSLTRPEKWVMPEQFTCSCAKLNLITANYWELKSFKGYQPFYGLKEFIPNFKVIMDCIDYILIIKGNNSFLS